MATVSDVILDNEMLQNLLKKTIDEIKRHSSRAAGIFAGIRRRVGLFVSSFRAGLAWNSYDITPGVVGASLSLTRLGATADIFRRTTYVNSVLCNEELLEGQITIDRYKESRNKLGDRVNEIKFTMEYGKMSLELIEDEILPFLQKENEALKQLQL